MTMYSLFMVLNASPSAFLEESLQGSVVSEHVNSGVRDTRREVIDVDQET